MGKIFIVRTSYIIRLRLKAMFFFFATLFIYSAVHSQDTTLQRLLRANDDITKVNRLHDYAQSLLNIDNDKANAIYEITIPLCEKLKYDLGSATGWRKVGYIHGQEGRYKEAINSFRKAIAYYTSGGGHLKDLLVCYNNMGANFHQFGKVDSTMHYYLMGIKKIEAWPLEKEDAAVRIDMLNTLSMLNENISTLYGNQFNAPKALEYGNKAVLIAKNIKDTVRMVLSTISISHAYYVNKEFLKGLYYAREAATLADLIDAPVAKAKAYHVLSANYTALNNPDSGIYAAKKAIEYARETDQQLYITSFLDLADAYHDKKEYSKEATVLQSALKEFNAVDNIAFGRNVYEKLADAKYALGEYKEAYDYYATANNYKDSMLSKQNRETIAELDVQYQTAEKEKALFNQQLQITQKNLQLEKSRQYIIYSISAVVIALLVTGLVFVNYKHKRKQHQRQLIAIKQEKEIQLLQAVMQGEERERSRIAKDLHDGVAGMLAAVKMHFTSIALKIGGVLQTEGYKQGVMLLDEASQEVRKTSHNLMPEVLLRHGLDEALRRYCNSINNSSTLVVQYDSLGEPIRFVDNFELSVYRIVQELLNNIVKHSRASGSIVQVSFQPDLFSITIEDNGVGLSKESLLKDGMGLHGLRLRVKAINGKMELDSGEGRGLNAYLEFETAGLEKQTALATA